MPEGGVLQGAAHQGDDLEDHGHLVGTRRRDVRHAAMAAVVHVAQYATDRFALSVADADQVEEDQRFVALLLEAPELDLVDDSADGLAVGEGRNGRAAFVDELVADLEVVLQWGLCDGGREEQGAGDSPWRSRGGTLVDGGRVHAGL